MSKIGQGLVEPLGPKMITRFGVDELDIDAHAVTAALNAALQHVTHVQVAPDLHQIDVLALIGEGGVAPDHDGAAYP
jgi:hypothetical protein